MKTGITYWFGHIIEGNTRMKLIKESGFDNVSLWWGDEFKDVEGPKEVLPDLARRNGLYVENAHSPCDGANLLWLDRPDAVEIVERYINCIKGCAEHKIPVLVLHLTSGFEPPPPCLLGIERLKRIIAEAERHDVIIALENLKRPDYLDYVFKEIASEKLMFCYDSGHENCYSKNSGLLDKYGSKLAVLHLHDNDGTGDQHCIPGEGNINWQEIAAKLKEKAFNGSVSLEVTNEFSRLYKDFTAAELLKAAYDKAAGIASLI